MRIDKNHWLYSKPIAHRGLWGGKFVENSISAYQNAVLHGYPIEIDVYLTKDGHLVSFHDEKLDRMTGVSGFVHEKTLSQLKALKLFNTNESIPTLDEVLTLTENKVPLLIEIKPQPDKTVVNKLVDRLKRYNGEFAIQSFNPFYINRVRKLAPNFIRGVLSNPLHKGNQNALKKWVVRKMPLNFIVKPDFLSIYHGALPLKKHKRKPILAWTITSKQIEENARKHADNIIFENYIPN